MKSDIKKYNKMLKETMEMKNEIYKKLENFILDNNQEKLKDKNITISQTLTDAISPYMVTFDDIQQMNNASIYIGLSLDFDEYKLVLGFMTDRYQTIKMDIEDSTLDIKELINSIMEAKIQIMNFHHQMMTKNVVDLI